MQLSRLLFCVALLSAPVALVGTTWLYFYPLFDDSCGFPQPPNSIAPFRLLALGDPQLEGDSSLPKPGAAVFPSLQYLANDVRNAGSWRRAWYLAKQGVIPVPRDFLKWAEGWRKRIDLWGNDWYLAHIVRTLRRSTAPSHVAVLGDLLGSQWISDEEFERRAERYWKRVFSGMERVPDAVMLGNATQGEKKWGGTLEVLGADSSWENRVINIAGNHDIGYAGDIDEGRIKRFEKAFGKVNWDIVFTLPDYLRPTGPLDVSEATQSMAELSLQVPALRLVVLNSMNLDTPAFVESLQRETYDFMNHIITTSRPVTDKTHATILLTHIPFHKEATICVDAPFFDFFEGGSGVKEQNMLSDYASKIILEGIFGLNSNHEAEGQGFGRRGIIINGHDHEGCDVLHYITQPGAASQCPQNIDFEDIHTPSDFRSNASSTPATAENAAGERSINETQTGQEAGPQEEEQPETQRPKWQAVRFPHPPFAVTSDGSCVALNHIPHMREITLRSMMGEFSGSAGFLSAWFDSTLGEKGAWKMEFNTCKLGVQHWWWAVHVVDLIVLVALVGGVFASVAKGMCMGDVKEKRRRRRSREKVIRRPVGSEKRAVANGPALGKVGEKRREGHSVA
ncbi:hypothetical protein BU26DRAFT_520768 [Trematosphaeria pertusa]|uniref:Calcineurin-like phosphoesterase domain-containing protein n=1 Tax=Trematosphaeria pertusa TaxID=390896 RepID=A0A6A6IB86_9PLEO|nr:uncharacterized protein BU26DRAFT_520768 [Trematosphaeria pertusa]KAF2247676.1 hypothetical protein BU26DRAFT_520768 [Trematosphaeria pertusa]